MCKRKRTKCDFYSLNTEMSNIVVTTDFYCVRVHHKFYFYTIIVYPRAIKCIPNFI